MDTNAILKKIAAELLKFRTYTSLVADFRDLGHRVHTLYLHIPGGDDWEIPLDTPAGAVTRSHSSEVMRLLVNRLPSVGGLWDLGYNIEVVKSLGEDGRPLRPPAGGMSTVITSSNSPLAHGYVALLVPRDPETSTS